MANKTPTTPEKRALLEGWGFTVGPRDPLFIFKRAPGEYVLIDDPFCEARGTDKSEAGPFPTLKAARVAYILLTSMQAKAS